MFNNNRGFRSSVRQGVTGFNSFRPKPARSGGYNSARGYTQGGFSRGRGGRGAHESKLIGQVDIFIKKANPASPETTETKSNFSDFGLSNNIIVNLINKGYTTPTPIQTQAIPSIMEGRDLIGLANTGTGKTGAFLIPIINKLFADRSQAVFIIAPTRELAVQINDEFRTIARGMPIYSTTLIGGSNIRRQISDLRRNPQVVIGTPGRLRDLIERNVLRLNEFSMFVLDEVDLMVDIGFVEDVKYFTSLLPKNRQSLFFSATISPKVEEILNTFVQDPVTVSVKKQDTAANVEQDVVRRSPSLPKIDQLHDLLIKEEAEKVLIFGKTKHGIEKLNKELETRGFRVGSIHGDKRQSQRQRVLQSFKSNEINILLATDVASRGLDIPNVTHVINYDLPQTYEDYIHRIGRTGRAGKTGIALTFVD